MHPAAREVLRFLKVDRGVEIHHDGDLPARSGMGSSSAFIIGLLHAMHALHGRMVDKHQLAMEGIHVEQECLKEAVGSQDQVMTAYGGLNHVRFLPSGEISVRPIIMPRQRMLELNAHMMLFFTGISRTASEIAGTYVGDIEQQRRQLRVMDTLVSEGLSILAGETDLSLFGMLLHEAWLIKRGLSKCVSNEQINAIYERALAAGAVGGKLLGAGGGGFILLFVPPDHHAAVRRALENLLYVPCKFEFSGSEIVFFDLEADYSSEERDHANQCIKPPQELPENREPFKPA
jgi:D-glycero-alpha-D-manno-heptose-7-phosphate kinase